MMILNSNLNFNKGVSKVLKAITLSLIQMFPGDQEKTVNFLRQRFGVGSLTQRNLLSFINYLIKVSS